MNQKLAADVLRIMFQTELVERKLFSAGLTLADRFLPNDNICDLIFDHAWSRGPKEVPDGFYDAWIYFKSGFESIEDFDPTKFVEWLAKGKFSRHPFVRNPSGFWNFPP